MKLYLASFLEPDNFGPSGKIIGVANGNKPFHLNIKTKFDPFIPSDQILEQYYESRNQGKLGEAAEKFRESYKQQLSDFVSLVKETAVQKKLAPQQLLPFAEGDTLGSWEREKNHHYRNILSECLRDLGYEVESH